MAYWCVTTAFRKIVLLALLIIEARSQFQRGAGEFLFPDVASDYMYRFRVAVTPKNNLVYGIQAPTSQVAAYRFNRTDRGVTPPSWTTDSIPGLTDAQPVLNVDSQTDQVYFIHPVNGNIYCFDASRAAPANTKPVWVSDFICTDPNNGLDQHRQAFTANGKLLLARCNDTVVLVNSKGKRVKTYATPRVQEFALASDLAAAIPTFANFSRMLTWYTRYDNDNNPTGSVLIWDLTVSSARPNRTVSSITLPKGIVIGGVNSASSWAITVVAADAPVILVYSQSSFKLASSFNFKRIVDPDDELEIRVLPTPAMVNRTMYGVVQGRKVSPYAWLYPDTYYFWAFALNYQSAKEPKLLWITQRTNTSGALAPQVPWVTSTAVFITEYQQNATRSFNLADGSTWFNAPSNPLSTARNAYSLIRGTYKISLPWASPDGMNLVFQYDDGSYDEDPESAYSVGYIRTMVGLPPRPPPPPMPPSPPLSPLSPSEP